MNTPNTTVVTLTVESSLGDIYTPRLLVADNGTWTLEGHEALRAAMSPEDWLAWQVDLWALPEVRGLRA